MIVLLLLTYQETHHKVVRSMVSETGSAFSMRMTSWEKSHGKEQVKGKNTGKEQVFPPRKVS